MEYFMAYLEDILIAIGLFFMPFVMVIFIAWFRSKTRSKRNQLQADLMAKALEHGQTLSEHLFDEPKRQRNPLNIGVVCIAVGIGIALFLGLLMNSIPSDEVPQVWTIGIIPFLVGVGFLIIHFIEKKKPTDENAK